jgi:hypothetical protein
MTPPLSLADDRFLRQVRWITLGFAVVLGGLLMLRVHPRFGAGFAVAGIWGVANLWALEHLIRLSLRPSGRQPLAIALALLVKLPLLYAAGAALVLTGAFPARALVLGVSLPLLVITLKALGRLVAPRLAGQGPGPGAGPGTGPGTGPGAPPGVGPGVGS